MHPILPFQQLLGDALIIHQPARRLPQCRIAQRRVVFAAGVETEVIDLGRIGLRSMRTPGALRSESN